MYVYVHLKEMTDININKHSFYMPYWLKSCEQYKKYL